MPDIYLFTGQAAPRDIRLRAAVIGGVLAALEADDAVVGVGALAIAAALAATEAADSVAAAGALALQAAAAITEAADTAAGTGALALAAAAALLEDADTVVAVGSQRAPITDTDALQKPVNVVMAGDVPIKDRWREFDIRPLNIKTKRIASAAPGQRLNGPVPSFKTRTDTRGYD